VIAFVSALCGLPSSSCRLAPHLFAVSGTIPRDKLDLSHLLREDGPPAVEAGRVLQDHLGFVWFPTDDGPVPDRDEGPAGGVINGRG